MKNEIITLASGCFWCTEAIFKRLKGVIKVTPGYSGESIKNPSYGQVSTGKTGFAEAVQIKFNPNIISLETILEIFFNTHDPTTLNRQGHDIGPQYRSAIFFHNEKQKKLAQNVKEKLEKEKAFGSSIVTEITPFANFYKAEGYHVDYYEKNKGNLYCNVVISPKIKKLLKKYQNQVKKEYKKRGLTKRKSKNLCV